MCKIQSQNSYSTHLCLINTYFDLEENEPRFLGSTNKYVVACFAPFFSGYDQMEILSDDDDADYEDEEIQSHFICHI